MAAVTPVDTSPASTRTPCDFPPCDDGPGEPCGRHETEQAHAEGEHAFCGYECTAGDFGHRPVEYDGAPICRRCWAPKRSVSLDAFGNASLHVGRDIAPWPCTSAVVLGLAVREVA